MSEPWVAGAMALLAETSPALFGGAWAVLVAAGAYRCRPAPRRLRNLLDMRSPAGSHVAGRHDANSACAAGFAAAGTAALERLGNVLLRCAGRAAAPAVARRLGAAVVVALGCLPVVPIAALPAAAVAWNAPGVAERRAARRRLDAMVSNLPDVVDLLVLAVGAGYSVRMAVAAAGRRAGGPLGEELRRVSEEAALGRRLADALDDLPVRAGEPVRPLVAALVASERYGAPLAAGLERLAGEVRASRRRRAEEAARRLPVKLLFPLVTCTLPAFGLLTVAPLIASALKSLRL